MLIYGDESWVNNKDLQFLVVGTIFCKKEERHIIKNGIETIKQKYGVKNEIKRRKVNKTLLPFFKEIVDYFVNSHLTFYGIRIDKDQLDLKQFHKDKHDIALYKRYYFLLKNRLIDDTKYYIYLDKRITAEKNKLPDLRRFLEYEKQTSWRSYIIQEINEYSSRDHIIIQLADFLTWCVCFAANTKKWGEAKQEIVNYLSDKLGSPIDACSLPSKSKFNLFCINLWIWGKR